MTVAEIRYIALKPLPLQSKEGERLTVEPGDEIPAALHGSWLFRSIEAGKVAEIPTIGSLEDATDADLKAEVARRGYRIVKNKTA